MPKTEAQLRSIKKWKDKNIKNITLSVRIPFAEQVDAYLKTEAGSQYKSRTDFFVTLAKQKMKEDGFVGE